MMNQHWIHLIYNNIEIINSELILSIFDLNTSSFSLINVPKEICLLNILFNNNIHASKLLFMDHFVRAKYLMNQSI